MMVFDPRPVETEDAMRRSFVTAGACFAALCFLLPSASDSAPKLLILENFVDYIG